MSGDTTIQMLKRLDQLLAGQEKWDVDITGGTIEGVSLVGVAVSIPDTDGSHDLSLACGSDLTADRTFTISPGDADRTLAFSGAGSSVTFNLTATTNITLPTSGTLTSFVGTAPVDNAIARFDGTTGGLVQASGASINDAGELVSGAAVATGSAGFHVKNNGGSDVAIFGAGGGTGASFLGGVNVSGLLAPATFSLPDSDASHRLAIATTSNLTANRTLTIVPGDANRTLTLPGDATVSGTNTGDQTITLTGNVTGSGTGSFATTIANGAVTNARQANMPANTVKVNATAAAAAPTDLALAASQVLGRGATGNIAPLSFGGGTTVVGTTVQLAAGTIIDRRYNENTANADLTTLTPYDDTPPQVTEGTQVLSETITPKTTTNRLRIRILLWGGGASAGDVVTAAIFVNGAANAVSAASSNLITSAGVPFLISHEFEYVPGAVSAQAITVRVGGAAGTIRLNGTNTARRYGGVGRCTLVIEEIVA